jgi:RimJ/RimL family protein N-acetyltransferase
MSDDIRTDRLTLRRWRDDDRVPFAALNADPEVMEHFPAPLTREQSDHFVEEIGRRIEDDGYGLWAVEPETGPAFIGFVGLLPVQFEAHFTPAVEVGWRLARDQWGKGYATEAAAAAVRFGFEEAGLDEIVSMAVPANTRSTAVMERIGMTHDPDDDFDHPRFPEGHRLRRRVLYRIRNHRPTG